MKTRAIFLAFSLVLIYSSTTEPQISMRATAQASGWETTPQHVRSDAWKP